MVKSESNLKRTKKGKENQEGNQNSCSIM
jgi:hypothetical protein